MNPVIRSVSVVPSTIKPGETATVYVDAVDPDSRIVSGTVEVLDAAGNKSTATTILTVGDQLRYMLTVNDPTVKVTADAADPSRFYLTVPA